MSFRLLYLIMIQVFGWLVLLGRGHGPRAVALPSSCRPGLVISAGLAVVDFQGLRRSTHLASASPLAALIFWTR